MAPKSRSATASTNAQRKTRSAEEAKTTANADSKVRKSTRTARGNLKATPSIVKAAKAVLKNHETTLKKSAKSAGSGSIGALSGSYEIICPSLQDEWEMYADHEFSLDLTLDGKTLWGEYDFGMHSGVLRSSGQLPTQAGEKLELQWRGRENSEGRMSFGASNRCWLQWTGQGAIKGMINCYGSAEFTGHRDAKLRGEITGNMRSEWESYNDDDYERENRSRWGKSSW